MKNLLTRTLTGAVYIALIVAGICINHLTFSILGCLLAGLGVAELLHLGGQRIRTMVFADIAGALILVSGLYTVSYSLTQGMSFPFLTVWGALFIACFIVRIIMQIYSGSTAPLRSMATSALAIGYIGLPIALMGCIYAATAGAALLLAVFVMLWLNDTGAYLVGSLIGRHKLFQRLSPKKSWEGFFGGLLFSIGSAPAFYYLFADSYAMRPLWFYIVMGATVSVFGTWGDLAESMLKRSLGVKDSGNIMPGHGGILDRIDSLLLAVPAVVVLMAISRLAGF